MSSTSLALSINYFYTDKNFALFCFIYILLTIVVEGNQFVKNGCWDSIHIVEALQGENSSKATYKLTTTVILHMSVEKDEVGKSSLSGTLTRQVT